MEFGAALVLVVLSLCGIIAIVVSPTGHPLDHLELISGIVGGLFFFGTLLIGLAVQCCAGPIQIHPRSFGFGPLWIRFRNAAYSEMYLRDEVSSGGQNGDDGSCFEG
jgi:hypothetical protein